MTEPRHQRGRQTSDPLDRVMLRANVSGRDSSALGFLRLTAVSRPPWENWSTSTPCDVPGTMQMTQASTSLWGGCASELRVLKVLGRQGVIHQVLS